MKFYYILTVFTLTTTFAADLDMTTYASRKSDIIDKYISGELSRSESLFLLKELKTKIEETSNVSISETTKQEETTLQPLEPNPSNVEKTVSGSNDIMERLENKSHAKGINLLNYLHINGYLHGRISSVDHDKFDDSWFQNIVDYFEDDTYLYLIADVDLNLRTQYVDIINRFYLGESGLDVTELYGQINLTSNSKLNIGLMESNRRYSSSRLSERIIRSRDFHYMEERFSNTFAYLINDLFYKKLTDPFYKSLSLLANTLDQGADYESIREEMDNNLKEFYAVLGISESDLPSVEDMQDPVVFEAKINELMSKISTQILGLFKAYSILASDYRGNYSKGVSYAHKFDNSEIYLSFRDSIWSDDPNFDEGHFGFDLGYNLQISENFLLGCNYGFEKFNKPDGIMNLIIPNADDNINNFNTFLEFQQGHITLVCEAGYFALNPLDTDVILGMLLLKYQFNEKLDISARYSHESLDTPFGDGSSNSFAISPSFKLNKNVMCRVEIGTESAEIGNLSDDVNHHIVLETLALF